MSFSQSDKSWVAGDLPFSDAFIISLVSSVQKPLRQQFSHIQYEGLIYFS
uniref:Uncharacterized protein n=1 Tax=Anguilla anguilla TaxID=7936 RepID=A0A0E9WDQ7_ANGAN